MENINKLKLTPLKHKELSNVYGGFAGLFPLAFLSGVAYGYIKEKFNSGQW